MRRRDGRRRVNGGRSAVRLGRRQRRMRAHLLAIELFVRGRGRRRGVGRRVFRVHPTWRGCGARRLPSRRRRQRRLIRRWPRRRTPLRGRSSVRRRPGRGRAISRGRPDRLTERIQALRRAGLIARRIVGAEARRRRERSGGRTPSWRGGCGLRRRCGGRSGRRLIRRGRRLVGLQRRCAPRRRCTGSARSRWRREGRRLRGRAPLWRGRRRWRRGRRRTRWTVGWRRARRRRRRRRRTWRRGQGGTARQTKLACRLVVCATPRADDHESDSRELRAPITAGVEAPPTNQEARACARAAYPVSREKARNRSGFGVTQAGLTPGPASARRPAQRSFSSATRAALPLRLRR